MSNGGSHQPFRACTGFPAAGEDFHGNRLSLDSLIRTNPAATFFMRAEEGSSLGGGIHPGDILVVDRGADIVPRCLVVAVLHGDLVLRQVVLRQGRYFLRSGTSPNTSDVQQQAHIWGRIVYVLHPVSP
jgi:DNA polymerase V